MSINNYVEARGVSDPIELASVISCPTWVLGVQLWPSV